MGGREVGKRKMDEDSLYCTNMVNWHVACPSMRACRQAGRLGGRQTDRDWDLQTDMHADWRTVTRKSQHKFVHEGRLGITISIIQLVIDYMFNSSTPEQPIYKSTCLQSRYRQLQYTHLSTRTLSLSTEELKDKATVGRSARVSTCAFHQRLHNS